MTDAFVDTPEEKADGWQTVVAAILLGIAATLTALSAYQAALTDGDALQGYTKSTAAQSESNFYYQQGNTVMAGDQTAFFQWSAVPESDQDTKDYLVTLMRPELAEALDWWAETGDEVITPFDEADDNPYFVEDFNSGFDYGEEAKAELAAATAADDQGDKFELATVLFALTLFFGGIATLFSRRGLTHALLGVGTISLVAGAVQLGFAFTA